MGAIWTLKDAREQLETLARAAEQGEPRHVALDGGDEVVTRNVRHFEPTGVKLLNPYEA